jgi:aryl-alcohol dehydrogenase-like predicted oxidoreductase
MYFGSRTDQAESFRIMDAFTEAGGTFIDTSNSYARWLPQGPGISEKTIGAWLRERGGRDRLVLATKARGPVFNVGGLSRKSLLAAAEQSLLRMSCDYIDLYYAHWDDWDTPMEETLSAFHQLIQDGKIRYYGFSNYYPWRVMKAIGLSRKHGMPVPVAVQPQWSLAVRHEPTAPFQTTFNAEYEALCREEGIGVVPYSPLASGFLTGKYTRENIKAAETSRRDEVIKCFAGDDNFARLERAKAIAAEKKVATSQLALAWLMNQSVPTVPIVGASSVDQLTQNLGADEVELTNDELRFLAYGDGGEE